MSKILFEGKEKDDRFYANRNRNEINNYKKSQNSQMNSEKHKARNAVLEFRGTNKKLKVDWQNEKHMELYGMKERRKKEDFCSDSYEMEERLKKEDLRDKLILKVSDRVRDRRLR